jgi:hypothetical protein
MADSCDPTSFDATGKARNGSDYFIQMIEDEVHVLRAGQPEQGAFRPIRIETESL